MVKFSEALNYIRIFKAQKLGCYKPPNAPIPKGISTPKFRLAREKARKLGLENLFALPGGFALRVVAPLSLVKEDDLASGRMFCYVLLVGHSATSKILILTN